MTLLHHHHPKGCGMVPWAAAQGRSGALPSCGLSHDDHLKDGDSG